MKQNSMVMSLILFSMLLYNTGVAQNNTQVKFTYQYPNKNNLDSIELIVKNTSGKRFFYSITLQGYNNTKWISLLSDINSLGTNEFLALKALNPGAKKIKYVSKKRILYLYAYQKIRAIRFGVMYYEKPNLNSKGEIIYLPSM